MNDTAPSGCTTRQPVRLVITVPEPQVPTPLIDWLHQRPEFRLSVAETGRRAPLGDSVLVAVVAESLLPGLFDLLKSWLAGQRAGAGLRVRLGEATLEIQADGRTDPLRLLADLRRGADARGADGRGADARGADARGADVRSADVRGADGGADARSVDARRDDPRRADARGADGRSANGLVAGVPPAPDRREAS
ncbi:pentapeptide repeat-containing protein [Plantactinospora siamensis]|uniref:Pentapeptide repeat-containing protein n=1 Tax=Plantactinospora siamensis TaxID=555372 RepID=A0ABV6P1F9_9ACTN